MEAPDKIYIGILPSKVGEGLVYTTVSKEYPYAKEYFRKDTLLALLKTKLSHLQEDFDVYTGQRIILRELINEIESL